MALSNSAKTTQQSLLLFVKTLKYNIEKSEGLKRCALPQGVCLILRSPPRSLPCAVLLSSLVILNLSSQVCDPFPGLHRVGNSRRGKEKVTCKPSPKPKPKPSLLSNTKTSSNPNPNPNSPLRLQASTAARHALTSAAAAKLLSPLTLPQLPQLLYPCSHSYCQTRRLLLTLTVTLSKLFSMYYASSTTTIGLTLTSTLILTLILTKTRTLMSVMGPQPLTNPSQ